jgi:hypothetical protein
MDNFRYFVVAAIALVAVFAIYMMVTASPVAEPVSLETKDFYRYVDEDMGVVCYVLNTGSAMSCLWLDEE